MSGLWGDTEGTFPSSPELNRYQRIMERIFFAHYQEGARELSFERDEMVHAAQELGINLPKNLGDVLYSFRYRSVLQNPFERKHQRGSIGLSVQMAGHVTVLCWQPLKLSFPISCWQK